MMRVSDKGLLEACEHEGIVPAPYFDSVGVLTVYVGHTKSAGGLNPAKMDRDMPADIDAAVIRALEVFRQDVPKYEKRVNAAFPGPLTQHQFDALFLWDFNTGGATWENKSSGKPCQLVQQVNRGDMSGDGFMGWVKPPELRKRRMAEQHLFLTGDYDGNGDKIPVWGTDGNANLVGRVKVLSGRDVLKMMGRDGLAHEEPAEAPVAGQGLLAAIVAIVAALFRRK